MSREQKKVSQGRRVIIGVLSSGLTALFTLFILWSTAQAAFRGGGAGNCGNFIDAVILAEDGDVVAQMIPTRNSGGAVITENLRISGGWFPNVNCEEANQYFTTTTDFLGYGFDYLAPAEQSGLEFNDSVLTLEDTNHPNFPNIDHLIIEHMTLHSTGSPLNGGGITGVISDGAKVLLDNVGLNGSFVLQNGGGIHLEVHGGSHLIIEDSQFITNTADTNGGGLYVELWDNSRLTIVNSLFDTNTGLNAGGLEVHVHDTSQLVIRNTLFVGNTNYSSLGVGAAGRIFVDGGQVNIDSSSFQNNVAGERGGGLYIEINGGEIVVSNSQFSNNSASTNGGGLYVDSVGSSPATVTVVNTRFVGNSPNAYEFVQSGSGVLQTAVLDQNIFLPVILNGPETEQARILNITLDETFNYVVEFETNFQPDIYDVHVHFFFDTVAPEDAGVPGSGPWILYGGPNPFTEYRFVDRPFESDGAEKMCVLVANHDHSIRLGTGNCVKLP